MAENPQDPNTGPDPASQPGDAGAMGGQPTDAPKDERTLAMLSHLLGFVTGFLVPLIIWLVKRDGAPFVEDQSKEALNFQITVLIAIVVSWLLMFVFIGCILFPIVLIVDLVFCIIAALKANDGVRYRYPVTLRLVK